MTLLLLFVLLFLSHLLISSFDLFLYKLTVFLLAIRLPCVSKHASTSRTERRTDGRTDMRTDIILWHHHALRNNNNNNNRALVVRQLQNVQ